MWIQIRNVGLIKIRWVINFETRPVKYVNSVRYVEGTPENGQASSFYKVFHLLFMLMGWDVSELRPPRAYLQVIYESEEPRWNNTDRGIQRTHRKTCPSAILSFINPTSNDLGVKRVSFRRKKKVNCWRRKGETKQSTYGNPQRSFKFTTQGSYYNIPKTNYVLCSYIHISTCQKKRVVSGLRRSDLRR
jgi:hypothetical protein